MYVIYVCIYIYIYYIDITITQQTNFKSQIPATGYCMYDNKLWPDLENAYQPSHLLDGKYMQTVEYSWDAIASVKPHSNNDRCAPIVINGISNSIQLPLSFRETGTFFTYIKSKLCKQGCYDFTRKRIMLTNTK